MGCYALTAKHTRLLLSHETKNETRQFSVASPAIGFCRQCELAIDRQEDALDIWPMSQSFSGSVLEFDSHCAVVRPDTNEVVSTGITPLAAVVEARIKLGLALNQEVLANHVIRLISRSEFLVRNQID